MTQPRSAFTPGALRLALVASVTKLDPRVQLRNPVMFVVEIGAAIATLGWLKQAFADRDELRAQVAPPREDGAPMTSIVISGLRQPLPEPAALKASIHEACAHAEEQVRRHSVLAAEYVEQFRHTT